MKRKSKVLFLIGALVVLGFIGGWYGYREFNRKNESVATMDPVFTISAAEMIQAFETDEPASLKRYAGKVIQFEGAIKAVEPVETGPVIVVLHHENSSGTIRVEMDSTQRAGALLLMPGKPATLRAVCTGYTADDMGLGADVLCNRGIIVKK